MSSCTDAQKQTQQTLLEQIVSISPASVSATVRFFDLPVDEALPKIPQDDPLYDDAQLMIQEWPKLKEILTRNVSNGEEFKQLILDTKNFFITSPIFSRTGANNPDKYDRALQIWLDYENGLYDREYSLEECDDHINKLQTGIEKINENKQTSDAAYNALNNLIQSGDTDEEYQKIRCFFHQCIGNNYEIIVIGVLFVNTAARLSLIGGPVTSAAAAVAALIGLMFITFAIFDILYCAIHDCFSQ